MTVEEMVTTYSNMLYKICIVMLCNEQDTQDAIQDTFCRYLEKRPVFSDAEHEKAWLIRVASNICRDMLRFRIRHPNISIEDLTDCCATPEEQSTLSGLLSLPVKNRSVIYLYYVEGYRIKEIADILGISEQTVKKRMQRGRDQLRLTWKEAYGK